MLATKRQGTTRWDFYDGHSVHALLFASRAVVPRPTSSCRLEAVGGDAVLPFFSQTPAMKLVVLFNSS
jgi:hypothetical protein